MLRLIELEQIPPLRVNGAELKMWKKVHVFVDMPVEDGFAFSEDSANNRKSSRVP